MGKPVFSGREVVEALAKNRFRVVDRTGSHGKLRYEHPTSEDDVRVVTVPMHDATESDTRRSIARQAGSQDVDAFCEWITETP